MDIDGEFQFSDLEVDSDSEDSHDLYADDPVFDTEEDLKEFMRSCNIEK